MPEAASKDTRRRRAILGAGVALAVAALTVPSAASGSPGDLDPGFGGAAHGRVDFDIGTVTDLAVEPNGKIVTVGFSTRGEAIVARFNADGTRDHRFGKVTLAGGSTPVDKARAVVAQPDGKIVVVGSVTDAAGQNDFGVWRVRPSGKPDTSFGGGDGFVELGNPGADELEAVTLDGQGRIVAAGFGQGLGPDVVLLRLTASGLPDPTFNNGSSSFDVTNFGTDFALAVAVQTDDEIVVGANYAGTTGYAVLRVTPGDLAPSGRAGLDPGFGNLGVADADGTLPASINTDVAVTPDGHILFLGQVPSTATAGAFDATVVRLSSGGAVDDTFGSATGARIAIPGSNVTGSALTLLSDGDVAVVGHRDTSSFVAELQQNGGPDNAMGPGGVKVMRVAREDLTTVAALPDGRIVAAGNVASVNVLYRVQGDLKPPSCGGKEATIIGTKAADTLVGTKHADVIAGLGGDDAITGLGKGDIICGGAGNDHLSGGRGGDHLYGGHGHDVLRGGPGNDLVRQ